MINFPTLQGLTIPEGVVTQIADANGRVLWSAIEPEVSILYLRPSADIVINHILYPTDSSDAYLLISEEKPDEASTYISCTFIAGDTSTYRKSSSFMFRCVDLPQKYKIKNARLVVRYGNIVGPQASLTGYQVNATISINGIDSDERSVDKRHPSDENGIAFYGTYYTDITDIMVNNSLSSDFAVTLTQVCSSCTPYETTGDNTGIKTYNTITKNITTAWIEVEYI